MAEDDQGLSGGNFPILPTCRKEGRERIAEADLTDAAREVADLNTTGSAE